MRGFLQTVARVDKQPARQKSMGTVFFTGTQRCGYHDPRISSLYASDPFILFMTFAQSVFDTRQI